MSADFFDRLEGELRLAAERQPSRRAGWSPVLRSATATAAVGAVILLALVPVVALLGNGDGEQAGQGANGTSSGVPELPPVGTVIGPNEPLDPRPNAPRRGFRSTVVATGVAPEAGPWQMEVYESERLADPDTGEEYQPAGLPCLGVTLPNPPDDLSIGPSGQCGEFPRTPGFSRVQLSVPDTRGASVAEVLVCGRAPEEAAGVIITRPGRSPMEVQLRGGTPGHARGLLSGCPGTGQARRRAALAR